MMFVILFVIFFFFLRIFYSFEDFFIVELLKVFEKFFQFNYSGDGQIFWCVVFFQFLVFLNLMIIFLSLWKFIFIILVEVSFVIFEEFKKFEEFFQFFF